MLKAWQFWLLTALAGLTALLIVLNMYRFSENRVLQAEVSGRAQFIQQTIPLEALSREIALALAQLGVRTQDAQIHSLLTSLGISVTVNAPAPAASPPPAPEAPPRGSKK